MDGMNGLGDRRVQAAPSFARESGYAELADSVLAQKALQPLQTLAVAGSAAGEGSTTIATGLACALGAMGEGRVLLVDCNLRSPSLAGALGLEGQPGLVDAVLGETGLAEAIVETGAPGLSVLPGGRPTADPSRLLASDGFKSLLAEAARTHALVVLDAAPINTARETAILSALVDGLLLVVRAERTSRPIIEKARDRVTTAGGSIVGVVLNRRRYPIPEALYRRL